MFGERRERLERAERMRSYERYLGELEDAVDAKGRAILPSDKVAADAAIDKALESIRRQAWFNRRVFPNLPQMHY